MTQEEKAKAYDDLLVKLQKAKVDNDVCDERYCCVINSIVPELKESEDEKIKRDIVTYLTQSADSATLKVNAQKFNKWIAWLEKQDEQKSILPKWKYKSDNAPLLKDSIILNKYGCVAKSPSGALVSDVWVIDYAELAKLPKEVEKQGEQKPAEYTLEQAAGIFLDALSNTPYNNKPITDAQVITKELLKFLTDTNSYNPNAVNEPKPAKWSEEDEYLLGETIQRLEELMRIAKYCGIDVQSYQRDIDWAKSLKDRVGYDKSL